MFIELNDLGLSNSSTAGKSGSKLLIPAADFHASRNELLAYKEALDQNAIVSATNTSGRNENGHAEFGISQPRIQRGGFIRAIVQDCYRKRPVLGPPP